MKITYTNTTGKLTLETEVANPKAAFETLAELSDLFDETTCKKCGSELIRFDVRRPGNFTYYNIVCKSCGCRLYFGQHVSGDTLFAKRKDDQGNPLPNGGWYLYQPESGNDGVRTSGSAGHREPAAGRQIPTTGSQVSDPWAMLIANAKDEKSLQEIGRTIKAQGDKIDPANAKMLRTLYDVRLRELGGKTNAR